MEGKGDVGKDNITGLVSLNPHYEHRKSVTHSFVHTFVQSFIHSLFFKFIYFSGYVQCL